MLTYGSAFERELAKLIFERRKSLTENVVSGVAIQSMERYREYVGRLAELDEVLGLFEVANKNVSENL
jgi:hypothetical protein